MKRRHRGQRERERARGKGLKLNPKALADHAEKIGGQEDGSASTGSRRMAQVSRGVPAAWESRLAVGGLLGASAVPRGWTPDTNSAWLPGFVRVLLRWPSSFRYIIVVGGTLIVSITVPSASSRRRVSILPVPRLSIRLLMSSADAGPALGRTAKVSTLKLFDLTGQVALVTGKRVSPICVCRRLEPCFVSVQAGKRRRR